MSTTIVLDRKSDYRVVPPKNDLEYIQLAGQYLAYENSLPVAERNILPDLVALNATYMAATAAVDELVTSEHNRAAASFVYKQTLDAMCGRLQWAIEGRARAFVNNLPLIEAWGVDTVPGASGYLIDFPTRQGGWLDLLDRYIAREESLPVEEQWQDPPLSDFETMREQIDTHSKARQAAQLKYRLNISVRHARAAALKNDLNLALHVLLATRYNYQISLELAYWGFKVQNRPSSPTPEPQPAEPEEV